jgi:hypothetical protein
VRTAGVRRGDVHARSRLGDSGSMSSGEQGKLCLMSTFHGLPLDGTVKKIILLNYKKIDQVDRWTGKGIRGTGPRSGSTTTQGGLHGAPPPVTHRRSHTMKPLLLAAAASAAPQAAPSNAPRLCKRHWPNPRSVPWKVWPGPQPVPPLGCQGICASISLAT